jgi:hypothetical protein
VTTKYLGDGIWARRTNLDASDIMMPVDVQSHHQDYTQTHNGVVLAPSSGSSVGAGWIDVSGFDELSVHTQSTVASSYSVYIDWSFDGVNQHGTEGNSSTTATFKTLTVPTKAKYVRINIFNTATDAPKSVTSYLFMKA